MKNFWIGVAAALVLVVSGYAAGEVHLVHADEATTSEQVATSTDSTGGQTGGTIITGDATASTSVDNELNTNISSNVDSPGQTNSSTITASTTNTADLTTEDETAAATGENAADGGVGLATVETGTAVATANVINVVNTNIFNSDGLILFLNQLFGGGLDLRTFNLSYFFDAEAGASPTVNPDTGQPQCTLLTCLNSSHVNVVDDNSATVTNSVIVRAATGENTASSTGDGGASINTGDAYAAANVLNLVNTNIINSSYLLVSFNNFGNLGGDITLPNADFFSKLFAHGGAMPAMNSSTYGVNNTNLATFVGTTTAGAETGDNTASTTGDGTGLVTTGDAYSSASTFTDANSNYVGGTSVFLLFRTWGEWTGSVKGLPAGMSWMHTPDGVVVYSDNSGLPSPEAPDANCKKKEGPVSNCFNSSSFLASTTNTAVVEDTIDVTATTGDNHAATEDGTSTVSTGNAYAVANVVNLINTNIVGRNWIFAIFNVFGDWSGDISFGQSDLQLAASTDATAPVRPGATVAYQFVVSNHGDADASDVTLKADFDKNMLDFGDAGAASTDTGTRWSLGALARGETHTFTYTAHVGGVPAGTSVTVPLTATVSSGAHSGVSVLFTVVTIDVTSPAASGGGSGGGGAGGGAGAGGASAGAFNSFANFGTATADPDISVKKSVSLGTTTLPATVDYKVVVTNSKTAGPAYNGVLTDTLYNPSGAVMYKRSWNLDTVAPGDQITLTYSVEYAASTTPGIYRNVARVTGVKGAPSGPLATVMPPAEGSGNIEFRANGIVLGVSTDAGVCKAVLSSFIKSGQKNNVLDVIALQSFLNTNQHEKLLITGTYSAATIAAVNRLQLKYKSEILAPSGLRGPTGMVAAATQKKINTLSCGGAPLAITAPAPQTQNTTVAKIKAVTKAVKASVPKITLPKKPTVAPAPATAALAPAAPTKGIGSWLGSLFSH